MAKNKQPQINTNPLLTSVNYPVMMKVEVGPFPAEGLFAFVNEKGQFLNPKAFVIMTKKDLLVLIDACQTQKNPSHKNALKALLACRDMGAIIDYVWSSPSDGTREVRKTLVTAGPGKAEPFFAPKSPSWFSVDQKSWGWISHHLLDHQEFLKSLCQQTGAHIQWDHLKISAQHQKRLDEGLVNVRPSNPATDLGSGVGYALFSLTLKQYLGQRSYRPTIVGAQIFETIDEAEQVARSKDFEKFIVVELDLSIKSLITNPNPERLGPLKESLALRQKQEITDAVRDAPGQKNKAPTKKM